jgi:hypothetical protein
LARAGAYRCGGDKVSELRFRLVFHEISVEAVPIYRGFGSMACVARDELISIFNQSLNRVLQGFREESMENMVMGKVNKAQDWLWQAGPRWEARGAEASGLHGKESGSVKTKRQVGCERGKKEKERREEWVGCGFSPRRSLNFENGFLFLDLVVGSKLFRIQTNSK